MVHKSSYRGVHSGNTLRAYNSRYSRRYHNQACIVSRVRPELIQKLARENAAADKQEELRNIAVGVALSLNKQSRWLLPPALIRQIRSNDIALPGLTVSLLERHKLKRPASCVSFHSNSGRVRRIQPRNGRYFGFNYSAVDGKSRRALRRERRETMKDANLNLTPGKVVEVFTEQGKAKRDMGYIGESEIQYEVFYPSPATSSISHNPKYIKQDDYVAPGDDSEHVLHGKPKKQHRGKQRKRMTLKDVDDCDLPFYHNHYDPVITAVVPDNIITEDLPPFADSTEQQKTTQCLLSSLIEKTERLQTMVGMTKSRRKKQNSSKTGKHHEDDKSHIVYMPGLQDLTQQEAQSHHGDQKDSKVSDQLQHLSLSSISAEATRVLLPTVDVTMASLKDCFEDRYFEASCIPRKFVLDVTPSVRDVLKKQGIAARVAENTQDAISYLICIHDGFYDDEYDVYKVLLNSRLHQGLLAIEMQAEDNQGLYRGTVMNIVSRTMDFVEALAAKLKEQNHFPASYEHTTVRGTGTDRQLRHHLGAAEAYIPSVQRMFRLGSAVSEVVMPSLSDLLQEEPAFCDICYVDVSPLTLDSASATALLRCRHRVCDTCWAQRIHSGLQQGFVRVTCPGFDCQEEVHVGVMLSVTALDTVDKLLQRQEEVRIGGSHTEKWCPNESCGRVIQLHSAPAGIGEDQFQQDVLCACGTHVCFQCLMPAHWPADCKQAEDYRTNLTNTVFPDRLAEVHDDGIVEQAARLRRELEQKKTMMVEGKHCPNCKSFVSKNGGGPQMVCRCGQSFCWFCARPGVSHPNRQGCVDVEQEKKLTTTVVVRHLEADKKEEEQQKSTANRRQRVSLMERAAEHRRHRSVKQQQGNIVTVLAKAVASAAAKDKTLSQHIISVCSGVSASSPQVFSTTAVPASPPHSHRTPSVLETATTFLKSALRCKEELHEVVEYTLVLLKDLPESLNRRRALRIAEDLGAFCSFVQSVFDAWSVPSGQVQLQEAVKAVVKLAEIQGWIHSALASHVVAIRKIRNTAVKQ